MAAFRHTLRDSDPDQSLRVFLQAHPEFRHLARRARSWAIPYGEIRDNLIAEGRSA